MKTQKAWKQNDPRFVDGVEIFSFAGKVPAGAAWKPALLV